MLTARQAQVLAYLRAFIAGEGIAPTFEEIMDGCSIASKSTVHRALSVMQERGYIRRLKGSPRGIELLVRPVAINADLDALTDVATQAMAETNSMRATVEAVLIEMGGNHV